MVARGAWKFPEAAWVERRCRPSLRQKVSEEHGGLRVGKGAFHTKFGEACC